MRNLAAVRGDRGSRRIFRYVDLNRVLRRGEITSLDDDRFGPNADVETRLSNRPLSGVDVRRSRTARLHLTDAVEKSVEMPAERGFRRLIAISGGGTRDDGAVAVDRGVTIGYFSQDVGEMAGRSARLGAL